MSEVTRILAAIEQGDPHAASEFAAVYDELRRLVEDGPRGPARRCRRRLWSTRRFRLVGEEVADTEQPGHFCRGC